MGASGAAMASASVVFVVLIGMVLFNGWPLDGLLRGGQDRAPIAGADGASAPAQTGTPNPGAPPGGGSGAAPSRRGGGADVGGGLSESGPGSPGSPGGGSGAGQPRGLSSQPPSVPGPTNAVGQTVSNVGNSVQGATDRLGGALGGSGGTELGGVVGGAGPTLNNNLKRLSGR
jgi:hypothetical protein